LENNTLVAVQFGITHENHLLNIYTWSSTEKVFRIIPRIRPHL
jgi:hypothetical protein